MRRTELTAREAFAAHRAAEALAQTPRLPAGLRYRLALLLRALQGPRDALLTAERALIEEYAERDAEGEFVPRETDGQPVPNSWRPRPGEEAAFEAALREMHHEAVTVDAPALELERYLEAMDAAQVDLPTAALVGLGPFLTEPGSAEASN